MTKRITFKHFFNDVVLSLNIKKDARRRILNKYNVEKITAQLSINYGQV